MGQTYTELVDLMHLDAGRISGYLKWIRSMSLLEQEIRGVSPRGLKRRCVYHMTTKKGEAVLQRWLELMADPLSRPASNF